MSEFVATSIYLVTAWLYVKTKVSQPLATRNPSRFVQTWSLWNFGLPIANNTPTSAIAKYSSYMYQLRNY